MTSPIVFTKDGEAEAKRLIEIVSKALDERKSEIVKPQP